MKKNDSNSIHPTKKRIIDAIGKMLVEIRPEQITITRVLEINHVSKGSFYYHFEDFDQALEMAQSQRYLQSIEASLLEFEDLLDGIDSRQALVQFIKNKLYWNSTDRLTEMNRLERVRTLGKTMNNPRLMTLLSAEQARITNRMVTLIEHLQSRGLVGERANPRVVATFLQAYTLGRVVDDIVDIKVDKNQWNEFIMLTLEEYLFT